MLLPEELNSLLYQDILECARNFEDYPLKQREIEYKTMVESLESNYERGSLPHVPDDVLILIRDQLFRDDKKEEDRPPEYLSMFFAPWLHGDHPIIARWNFNGHTAGRPRGFPCIIFLFLDAATSKFINDFCETRGQNYPTILCDAWKSARESMTITVHISYCVCEHLFILEFGDYSARKCITFPQIRK